MFTLKEIKHVLKKKSNLGDANIKIKGISIDSRTIKKGELFIAIKGPNFDGHKFINTAIQKGATAIIISQQTKSDPRGLILVKDTTKVLGMIAEYHRQRFDVPVIAITGSAGKTTTKEMVADVLSVRYRVLKNYKTENNQYGVPLTLLKLKSSHTMVVLELGTSQKGDIAWLTQIVRPTVAIFTNIGASHLQGLKTLAGIFREKWGITKYMNHEGYIIFNRDDQYLRRIEDKTIMAKRITYAIDASAEYKASKITRTKNNQLQFSMNRHVFTLKSPASHNIKNALTAISCGRLFKITYNEIITRLSRFTFPDGRQSIQKWQKGWLIDDTYNANPISFNEAIQTLNNFNITGKKILVCGDMAELGIQSQKYHQELGEHIARTSIESVVAIGIEMQQTVKTIKNLNKNIQVFYYIKLSTLIQRLKQIINPMDVILVKGSRCMGMEKVVDYLRN
ncbi:UDP-N-acetylmuramoyl-tripeptide--D-alanyl-D-alanine ligase [hydrothermal vent metagenome]|uniref:UDP-MurNAc-pentapeptide synthetase n=1 Tax=hydrothermal vent metagenome TaxID=652676 RepID=A0A3B1DVK1_9ZZZZ